MKAISLGSMAWICVAWLFMTTTCGLAADKAESLPAKEKFYLFLLVGQSNMAGRGDVEESDRQVNPRVLMYNQNQEWVPAVDPLHFDKPKVVGVGLGKTFALEVLPTLPEDVVVGLIPCAVGGSPISAWEPGAYDKPTKTHPYDDMQKRAQTALESGTLKGILWHQGESDSGPGKAEVYEQKLHELIARLRSEFHAPEVPFIAGQMGQFPKNPWSDSKKLVDSVHQSLPQKVPYTGFANSDGLNHRGDSVHFDSASYRELGRRYAKEYLELTP